MTVRDGQFPPRRVEIAALFAVLAAALVLRLPGLAGPLWYDEVMTLVTHVRLPWAEMMRDYSMNHHYFFSFQAKLAVDLLGEGPLALRLPALVFGLAGIWAAWWLSRPLAGPGMALLVAALLAVSYHHIWFSQNARGYTELAFWCTLGMGMFLRGLATPTAAIWAGFALSVALAIFTHLTGAFFFFALGLVWIGVALRRGAVDRRLVWRPLAAFAGGVLIALALLSPVLPSLVDTLGAVSEEEATTELVTQFSNPLWTAAEVLRTALGRAGPLAIAVGLAVLALATLGAVSGGAGLRLVGLVVLVHVGASTLILLTVGMRIWPRFFFPDIGLLLLLLACGMRAVAVRVGRGLGGAGLARLFVGLGGAAMLALSFGLALRNYTAPKQGLEAAIAVAEAELSPGERVFAVGHAADVYEMYYDKGWGRIMTAEEYLAAMARPGPVTLVVGFPGRTFEEVPPMAQDLEAGRLNRLAYLPGTLGDGGAVVLRRFP